MKKYTDTHMVRMEYLNHHESLYAGRAAEWLMEASFVTIDPETRKPAAHGMTLDDTDDILELQARKRADEFFR